MLPDFIIIGAAKCGTTSLYHYLRQHPAVFMCTPKEPEYFSGTDKIDTLSEYEALFEEADAGQTVGEASVCYLHSPQACKRIKETVPDVRLIAILRDPADRAYSHYNMMVAHGAIPNRPYLEVLEEAHRQGNYDYTGIPTSRYAEPLQRYFDRFGKDRLRVYLHRNYKRDPSGTVRSIFKHIGVDPTYVPDVERRHNKTHLPRSDQMNRFIWGKSTLKEAAKAVLPDIIRRKLSQLLHHANRSPVPPLSSEARALIIDVLRDDIERTEELLDYDLSDWKKRDISLSQTVNQRTRSR